MAIAAQAMEILDTITQIRRLVKSVMLQGGILYQNKLKIKLYYMQTYYQKQ